MHLAPRSPPVDAHTRALIQLAISEDLGESGPRGDKTVELSIPENQATSANIVARKPGVIAGTYLLDAILHGYDAGGTPARATILTPDGSRVSPDQSVATLTGSARQLLSAERVLLNFLSHLSGIATLTRQYVDAIADIQAAHQGRPVITDTRKTTPAFRALDKYAVRCGGGVNHRMGLYDGVMLKDNHLLALRTQLGEGGQGTLAQLTARIRAELRSTIPLWLEVDTLAQLAEALHSDGTPGPDIILLDNFTPAQLDQAVQLRNAAQSKIQNPKSKIQLEASGGITLDNLREVAQTGIDRIAIGALTHSAPILDLSLELH